MTEEEAGVAECHFSGGIPVTGKLVPARHPRGLVLLLFLPFLYLSPGAEALRPSCRGLVCLAGKAAGTYSTPILVGKAG